MPFIIAIIRRAVRFLSLSSLAYSAHPPPPPVGWQYVQLTASAFEMNPIDARN
jgi:hypothetical protein